MFDTPPCRYWLGLSYTPWLTSLALWMLFFFCGICLHLTPLHHSQFKCQMPLTGTLMAWDAVHKAEGCGAPRKSQSQTGFLAIAAIFTASPTFAWSGSSTPHVHLLAHTNPALSHRHSQPHCTHYSDQKQMPLGRRPLRSEHGNPT